MEVDEGEMAEREGYVCIGVPLYVGLKEHDCVFGIDQEGQGVYRCVCVGVGVGVPLWCSIGVPLKNT